MSDPIEDMTPEAMDEWLSNAWRTMKVSGQEAEAKALLEKDKHRLEIERDDWEGRLKAYLTGSELEALRIRVAELEEKLDTYESDYTICDCCECLTPDPVDAGGHMQCKSCTRITAQTETIDDMTTSMAELQADRIEDKKRIAELVAVAEAAEKAIQKSIVSRIAVWPELHRLLRAAGYLKEQRE